MAKKASCRSKLCHVKLWWRPEYVFKLAIVVWSVRSRYRRKVKLHIITLKKVGKTKVNTVESNKTTICPYRRMNSSKCRKATQQVFLSRMSSQTKLRFVHIVESTVRKVGKQCNKLFVKNVELDKLVICLYCQMSRSTTRKSMRHAFLAMISIRTKLRFVHFVA